MRAVPSPPAASAGDPSPQAVVLAAVARWAPGCWPAAPTTAATARPTARRRTARARPRSPSASSAPSGFKEAGLYDEYMKLNPDIKIKRERRSSGTRTTTRSSLNHLQHRQRARRTSRPSRSATSPRSSPPRPTSSSTWPRRRVSDKTQVAATGSGRRPPPRTARRSASAPTSARWRSATARTSSRRPVCPPTATRSASCGRATGTSTSTRARSTRRRRPRAPPSWTPRRRSINAVARQREASSFYDTDGKVIYKTNPAVKDAWDLTAEAAEEGLIGQADSSSSRPGTRRYRQQQVRHGRLPAVDARLHPGARPEPAGKGKWDVAAAPKPGNWGGSFLGVPKSGKHEEEAQKLVAWLTAPEQQAKLFKAGQLPERPGRVHAARGHRRQARVLRRRADRRRSSPRPPRPSRSR